MTHLPNASTQKFLGELAYEDKIVKQHKKVV